MPGLVAILTSRPKEEAEHDLNIMLGTMLHESFYTYGTYSHENLGVYVGWSIHKGSFSDCMPVVNERRDLLLIFSGEDFRKREEKEKLRAQGHELEAVNASYLIHLYEEKGPEFFGSLNGFFSGIILDLRERKCVFFNDRYGMGRMYYWEDKGEFLFSSEAKALLKIRPKLRKIDPKGLGEYFVCDCVFENRTLFSGISVLPAGSEWTFDEDRQLKKRHYFEPSEWEDQQHLEKEQFYCRLDETFKRILPLYFLENQDLAMSLTSGLDTRMIMACSNRQAGSLPCYTFSGMYRETMDSRIARKVAFACDQPYTLITLGSDFLTKFPSLAEQTIYRTDGCHDAIGSYEIYFNRLAREIASIRMTGKFGSEVVRNHSMFKPSLPARQLFNPDFYNYLEKAEHKFWELKKRHELSFAVMNEIPLHEYGRLSAEMNIVTIRTPYMDNELVNLMYQAPPTLRGSNEIALRLVKENSPSLWRIMTDRGDGGIQGRILSKVAKTFFFGLFKAEYVYLYQLPNSLSDVGPLLSALKLDQLIVGRYQLAYYQKWFGDELSEYIRDVLLDGKANKRRHLAKGVVETLLSKKSAKSWNYVVEINKILTVELIYKLLIEGI